MTELLQIVGRFHPLILHLPIGIFVFVFILELYSKYKNDNSNNKAISLGLLLGMTFSIVTCITGLLLANGGDYTGNTVSWHKWGGIAMTILSILIYNLQLTKVKEGDSKFYFPLFALLMILLTITGHKGGSITHGENFLFAKNEVSIQLENIDESVAYEQLVVPIFKSKCTSCHNSSKAKGKLVMTSFENLMKGGENGTILVAGSPQESEMIKRIHLPIEEEEHMPPKSKKQLTDDEIVLLEWWIEHGASPVSKVGDIAQSEEIKAVLSKYSKPKSQYEQINVAPIEEATLVSLREKEIPVYGIAEESPFVTVNMAHRDDIRKTDLRQLKKVDDQLSILNLSFSNVDDDMLSALHKMPHIRNLQLQKTNVTDKGVRYIRGMKYLEILNLYGTRVSDQIYEVVQSLPSLKSVYLWQTNVTDDMVGKLQEERPLLQISYKQDTSIFGSSELKPPVIIAESDLFKDSLEVTLKLNFRNVTIHYTLDGSAPDSLSPIYEDPFVIDQTTLIRALSMKVGWGTSETAERQFVQSKYDIKDIVLQSPPADKYKGEGGNTLADFVKGSTAFTDGNWLGYEGKHLTATLDLGEEVIVENVTVSALESTGSWIFYPKGLTIWTSTDGQNFDLKKKSSYPQANAGDLPSRKNFTESIESSQVRYVKVKVESHLKNPDWHPAPGGKTWIFVDEIVVN